MISGENPTIFGNIHMDKYLANVQPFKLLGVTSLVEKT